MTINPEEPEQSKGRPLIFAKSHETRAHPAPFQMINQPTKPQPESPEHSRRQACPSRQQDEPARRAGSSWNSDIAHRIRITLPPVGRFTVENHAGYRKTTEQEHVATQTEVTSRKVVESRSRLSLSS